MENPSYTPADLPTFPTSPGVYQFYDQAGEILYVGKANNLKSRVSSYFNALGQASLKTKALVQKIKTIRFILVDTPYQALLLESNLIKAHQPRYNILLKDGKTYPYLCLTQEPFPRLIMTRQRHPSLGRYFGPFTDTKTLEQIQELIKELYPLRTCRLNLAPAQLAKQRYKVCLAYHLGQCLGPCEGLQEEKAYDQDIQEVIALLKGHFQPVKKKIKARMLAASDRLDFKGAHSYQEKLKAIERYQARSLITDPERGDIDVLGWVGNEQEAFLSYLRLHQGRVSFAQTIILKKKLQERDEDLMALALCHFREKTTSQAGLVIANVPIEPLPDGVKLILPKIGPYKHLVELALKNAFYFKKERLEKKEKKERGRRTPLIHLQQDLRLKTVPMHIECFDNSNLQGTHPVAAMVCFKEGRPAKRSYRHFHVKSVEGPDDFASMREIVGRRYGRLIASGKALPDLVLIDGGKGQLSAAVEALREVGAYGQVAVVSIAKRLEYLFVPEDPLPLLLDKRSVSLKLLQQIRDEAHRFAITFHRQVRGKAALESILTQIPGIGPQRAQKLLKRFGSVGALQQAPLEQIAEVVGAQQAEQVRGFLVQMADEQAQG